jgi:hypothetical protein
MHRHTMAKAGVGDDAPAHLDGAIEVAGAVGGVRRGCREEECDGRRHVECNHRQNQRPAYGLARGPPPRHSGGRPSAVAVQERGTLVVAARRHVAIERGRHASPDRAAVRASAKRRD